MTTLTDPTTTTFATGDQPEERRRRWLLWLIPAAMSACVGSIVLAALLQPEPPERFLGIGDITIDNPGSEPMWWLDPVVTPPPPDAREPAVEVLVPSDGLFAFGSHQIEPASRAAIAKTIADATDDSTVIGGHVRCHTDNIGTDHDNQVLSHRRAASIMALLTELGVDPDVIAPVGLGETEPAHDNTTETGRALNRRCELRLQLAP